VRGHEQSGGGDESFEYQHGFSSKVCRLDSAVGTMSPDAPRTDSPPMPERDRAGQPASSDHMALSEGSTDGHG
jgi:hypothetical protein